MTQAAAARQKEGWGGLAKHQYRRMLSLSLMLPLLQQASGINTVIYYSSMVFLRAGLKSPILGSILVGAINLSFTAVAAALMDRRGRKPLLQASFGGMAAALAAVALAVAVPSPPVMQGALTVTLMLLYVAFFAVGAPWGCLAPRGASRCATAVSVLLFICRCPRPLLHPHPRPSPPPTRNPQPHPHET